MNGEAGVHQWNLTHQQTQNVLYYFWIESIIYGPIIFFTKFSILLLYLRLLVPTHWSPLWVVNHIIIAISAMFYASITLAKIWQCSPREKTWDDNTPGTCINLPLLLQVSGLFNTISDVLILLVPIKPVSTLRVSWWKKVGICGIFTIGAVAPIFSALGFYARVIGARSRDLTYNNPKILLWGTAEITTGIICACLPTLPSLIRGPRTQSASTFPPNPLSLGRNSETEVKEYIELRESGLETGRGSGQLTRHSQVREV
ncbi:hypothetical protein M011DRAFT_255856 [Sporormia fimetaria CBS 119925]|uniref:Rhodopsin domain-containing protein n=1 Tax=Sporormia fimetaria CBS 119925 TaxID=1340428 RepID=A0A6A6V0M6_9PLEO|nr:hypothetical protein M011DRAFT_255856 [Sporormia fimetaria CBS 119925]